MYILVNTEIAKNPGCILKDIKDLTDLEAVRLKKLCQVWTRRDTVFSQFF